MTWERIPEESWREQRGHVERYDWAAMMMRPGDIVLDVACGIGYGAQVIDYWNVGVTYHGFDRPGVPAAQFAQFGSFWGCDLDHWHPPVACDVSLCFETLEHVNNPQRLAAQLLATTRRMLIASVPTVPTRHMNPFHLHDFTVASAKALFAGASRIEIEPQPHELSHIFYVTP